MSRATLLQLLVIGALLGPGLGSALRGALLVEISWQDNVTNGERPEDVLGALRGSVEWPALVKRGNLPGRQSWEAMLGGRAEFWPRFEGLGVVAPGARLVWEWRAGLGAQRPRLAVEADGEYVRGAEDERSGWGGGARLVVRQRLGSLGRLSVAHDWRRFDARGRAFDRTGREWQGRLEWNLAPGWSLAGEYRRRVGDVVSYSRPPRPDLEKLGKPITKVETFEQGGPWIAYYFGAETRTGAVEVSRFSEAARWTLRHEVRDTFHAGPGYRNRLTMVQWIVPL